MSGNTIRVLASAAFGLISLVLAGILSATGHDVPSWLVGITGAAAGYFFGYVNANGVH